MIKKCICGAPTEADRYKYCYPCWSTLDERNQAATAIALRNHMAALRKREALLVKALEKIADPRKRDHKESDAYTELGCVMNIASDALAAKP